MSEAVYDRLNRSANKFKAYRDLGWHVSGKMSCFFNSNSKYETSNSLSVSVIE